jgi:hypothetical protein
MEFIFKPYKNIKGTITHISIDIIDKEQKKAFGTAHEIKLCMRDLGRIETTSYDKEEFEKLETLYKRGVNMFEGGKNFFKIE